ncbi:hypothetical protein BIWAKO_07029 [Bosea sp. BIWAKO-01]|nr:hypothetical protein BIWAKO_07029 [Bosea sp. BIWAKO-01]
MIGATSILIIIVSVRAIGDCIELLPPARLTPTVQDNVKLEHRK